MPFQLSIAAGLVSRYFARTCLERHGLSIPEWRVLAAVGRLEAISPSRVSAETHMDKVKVSRAAAVLVSRGFLRQSANPTDGRARVLRMTAKGQRLIATLVPQVRESESELVATLNRNEWVALRRTLTKLQDRLSAEADPRAEEA